MRKLICFERLLGDYRGVTSQITGLITQHLPFGTWTRSSLARRLPENMRLNFGLFVDKNRQVLMSHGVADKNYLLRRSPEGELRINRFEQVFVPGPWLRDKLLANEHVTLSPDQISCVGWPRLDFLLQQQSRRKSGHREQLNLLWAPTHDWRKWGDEQVSCSSFPEFQPEFEALSKYYSTDVSLHPRNRRVKRPTSHKLIEADVVISDIGTMVYEAWALGKPVIFPTWLIGEYVLKYSSGSAEAHIFEHKIGYHPESPEQLRQILNDGPVITPDVTEFMEAYLPPSFNGISGRTVAQLLQDLAQS